MKKLIIQNKKPILLSLVTCILFPIVFLTSSPHGFIPLDIRKVIVGYGGSILGGFIGIIGIYITIHHENEKQIYQNKRNALPLLDIMKVDEYDYRYKYIKFDFVFTEESKNRLRKNIADTANVTICIKNIGYRELYDLYIGDFNAERFKEEGMYYHMKPIIYKNHDLKINLMFYELGNYDNDPFENKYHSFICPLYFSCYYKDCYNNWYKQDFYVSLIFRLEQNISINNRALNISYERADILSAPIEIHENNLPWKNKNNICEC